MREIWRNRRGGATLVARGGIPDGHEEEVPASHSEASGAARPAGGTRAAHRAAAARVVAASLDGRVADGAGPGPQYRVVPRCAGGRRRRAVGGERAGTWRADEGGG